MHCVGVTRYLISWIEGVFENSMLRRIFESEKEKATRVWIKLHSERSVIIISLHQILLG
jgi:hypothetical protein